MDESKEPNQSGPEIEFQLSEADQAAVDTFFEDTESGSEPERLNQLTRLLGLMDTPVSDLGNRESLVDVTELRAQTGSTDLMLTAASASSVDDWIDGHEALTERDLAHQQLSELVTSGSVYSETEREALVNKTLGLIQDEIDHSEKRYLMDMPISPGGRFRLADLVSLAATLLLVASVTIPVLSGIRSRSMQTICNNNMATAGSAFGAYAGSNRDLLPMATAGFGSGSNATWMDVGTTPERSNSSNLYMLIRTNYATLNDLACPTNPDALVEGDGNAQQDWRSLDEISYSYRIMTPGGLKTHAVDQPVRVVLLSDRSPVIRRIVSKQPVRPEENTPNHNHAGQHVLGLDGSSTWHRDPVLDQGDNLWFPRPVEEFIYRARDRMGIIKGNELPDGPTDAFVGP